MTPKVPLLSEEMSLAAGALAGLGSPYTEFANDLSGLAIKVAALERQLERGVYVWPNWEQAVIDVLRAGGCKCPKPLYGLRPGGGGPRCRLCNTEPLHSKPVVKDDLYHSTPTEQRVLNRALMASVEIVDAPSPTASDDIFAPDVGPTASIIGFAPTASDEKGCAECESPAGIHAEGCASRDPSEKIHSGANVSSKIERAITCATQGHLWGPLGKCVMCEEPRPTASREGEFINSDAVNAAFEKFAPEVSFEDASQIVRAIRAALSTPPAEAVEAAKSCDRLADDYKETAPGLAQDLRLAARALRSQRGVDDAAVERADAAFVAWPDDDRRGAIRAALEAAAQAKEQK